MTREEMDRILGINPKDVWVPDFDYGEEISEEENEELTRLLESLTEDDLQIAKREIYHVPTHSVVYQETLLEV